MTVGMKVNQNMSLTVRGFYQPCSLNTEPTGERNARASVPVTQPEGSLATPSAEEPQVSL
jgi:hypothetical protein